MKALLALVVLLALPADESFEGKLQPQLVKSAKERWMVEKMPPASEKERAKFPAPLQNDDLAWMETLKWTGSGGPRAVGLVDKPEGQKLLLIDLNANGKFDPNEVWPFRKSPKEEGTYDMLWQVGKASGPFRAVQVRFRILLSNSKPGEPQMLHIDDSFLVEGAVDIRGKSVKVAFEYDPDVEQLDPKIGRHGFDLNGDGDVDFSSASMESDFARNETAIFRMDDLYLSVAKLDLKNFRFTVRTHPAKDYKRIELVPGNSLPDFPFVDFEGKKRQLSDYRGKYVLLDFWGSWCPPCISDLPHLQTVYSRYRERGFEIIGMTHDEDFGAAKKAIEKNSCEYVNARPSSVRDLIEKRFRISSYPTLVLITPEGKVHTVGSSLRGKGMDDVLAGIFGVE